MNDMCIIGSTAIKHYYNDFNREPKDLDLCVRNKYDLRSNKDVEFLVNPVLLNYVNGVFPTENQLLTLKVSHILYDINWSKHMFDIQFLLDKGCEIDIVLLKDLRIYWSNNLPYIRRSELNQDKDQFFNNDVNKKSDYDHDLIHTLLNESPIYKKCLKDGEEVDLDPNKFFNLNHEDKLLFVKEEVMVMAWERFKTKKYYIAYQEMLNKFIREHIPLFALEFAIKNYKELVKIPFDYITKINKQLN